MLKKRLLQISGILAVLTAIYHSIVGDAILRSLEITPPDQIDFVRSTYQLGSMGWIAGGVLLFAAANMTSQQARNWIIGVFVVMYGIPAIGTIALSGGRPNIGGLALAVVIVLALLGRQKLHQEMN